MTPALPSPSAVAGAQRRSGEGQRVDSRKEEIPRLALRVAKEGPSQAKACGLGWVGSRGGLGVKVVFMCCQV